MSYLDQVKSWVNQFLFQVKKIKFESSIFQIGFGGMG